MTDAGTARFQFLWHEFSVQSDAPLSVGPTARRWPWPAEFTVSYRVEHRDGRCQVSEQGDDWISCEALVVPALLRARMVGRAMEVAEQKGWTPFVGTVLSRAGRRVCLVGPPAARAAAAATREPGGWQVDSADSWVSRDGLIVPTPTADIDRAADPSPVDYVECCTPTTPLVGLLGSAMARCTPRSAVVREVACLLSVACSRAGTAPPGGRVA